MDPVIDQPIPNTQVENPPVVTSTLSAEPAQQASTEDANSKEKLKPIQTAHSVIRIDDKDLKRHISFQQGGETSPTIPRSPTNKSPKLRLFVEQNILNNPTLIKQSRVKDDERIFSFDELGLDTRPMSTYSLETTDTIESNVIQSFSSLRLSYQKTMEMRRQPVLAGYAKRFFEFQLFLYREFSNTMMSNHIKGVLILLDVLVDIAFLMLYLVEVSLSDTPDKDDPNLQPYYIYINRPQIIYHLAFAFSMWNLASFVSRVVFGINSMMRTVFSFVGIIDFLTCLPFLLSLQIPNGNLLFIPYFLRSLVVTPRIRRLLNIQVELSEGEGAEPFDPLKERLIVLILTILAIVYTGLCSFIYVELMFADKRYDLVSAFYFIMITVSTVGYGDISPSSIAGRVVIILLIIVALSVIPGLIQSTVETVNRTREGGGSFAPGKSEFVVIIGTFDTVSRVNDILQAFFNKESFSNTKQKLVFLSRKSAPPAVTAILSTHFYQSWASYIQGSALNERDLRRVQLKNASAIFIVTDFNSASVVEDERNVLRVWSINRFAPNVPLYAYLNRPEFETYHIQFARDVACVEDIKQALLAYNCLYRGSSTLILSLLINIIPLKQYEKPWMVQFGDGLGNEIYERRVNEIFVGMSFAEVSWYLYREFQVILMAVRTRIHNERGATEHHPNDSDYYSHIILNPGKSYIFKAHDDCIYIAQGPSDIDDIEDLTRDQYFRSTQVSPIMDPTYKLMSQVYPSISKSLRGSHASLVSSMRSRSPSPTRSLANMVTSPEIQICPPSPDKSDFISIRSAAETALTSVSEPEAPFAECKVPLCHVLDTPATLEDCIIQNASHLYRHIIACTQNYNVFRIVCTLRIAHLKPDEIRPIVFLQTVLPTEEEFEPLKTFPHVYFMLGNPRSRRDLIRANIGAADKVFITPDDTGASDENDRDFCDAESILTKHVITKVATEHGDPNKLCIVEILERESVHFLGVKYQADGGLLALKKKKKKRKAANAIVDFTYDEKYASGEALVTPMLDTILYQSHSNHCLLEMVKLLTGIRSHEDLELDRYLNVEPSYLCYIDVPKTCVGKPFSLFYQMLTLNFGVVPLGLYRRPDVSLENTNSFVYTNPMSRILLKSSDLVYVLKSGRD